MEASQRIRTVQLSALGALVAASALLSGCASTGPAIVAPELELRSVELTELGFYGQTFLLGFDVHNPNPFPLPVRNVRYELTLDNRRFAGGETQSGFVVGAKSDAEFAISVELDLRQSASGFHTLIESGFERAVKYELQGSLRLDLPAAPPISFSEAGTVRLRAH